MTVTLQQRAAAELELRRRAQIERGRTDWLWYAEEVLGFDLSDDFRELFRAAQDNRRTYVVGANGVGKSHGIARLAVTYMALYWELGAKVLLTGPSADQLKQSSWPEIEEAVEEARERGVWLPGEVLATEWKPGRGARLWRRTARNQGSLKGAHGKYVLILVEEAGSVDEWVWDAIRQMTSGSTEKVVAIGNPDAGAGHFWEAHNVKASGARIKITARTHPNVVYGLKRLGITWDEFCDLTPAQALELDFPEDWSEPIPGGPSLVQLAEDIADGVGPGTEDWGRIVLAEFPSDRPNQLIPREHLRLATQAHEHSEACPKGCDREGGPRLEIDEQSDRRGGLDLARYGGDLCVLVLVDGGVVTDVKTWSLERGKEDLDVVADVAIRAMQDGYVISYDKGGLGETWRTLMKAKGAPAGKYVEISPSGDVADKTTYFDKRAELWSHLALALARGDLDLSQLAKNHPRQWRMLETELTAVEYQIVKGKRKVSSKDEIKARIGRSPDLSDALCLAVYKPKRAGGRIAAVPVGHRSARPRGARI